LDKKAIHDYYNKLGNRFAPTPIPSPTRRGEQETQPSTTPLQGEGSKKTPPPTSTLQRRGEQETQPSTTPLRGEGSKKNSKSPSPSGGGDRDGGKPKLYL